MKQCDVTILMTMYNGGEYLRYSIESVLNQTFKNFEFLIINDCSTDDSLKVIESYNDERIVVYTNEKNMGQTRSLNKGLELARGKYIARIDADDAAMPLWIERVYSFISKNPEYVIVSADALIIDSANKVKRILKSSSSYSSVVLKSITASPINHGGCIMKRDIVLDNSGYDDSFGIAADYDLWSRLIRKGYKFTSLSEELMAVRFHEGSLSIAGKGTEDLAELSKIIYENVKGLTEYDIKKEDAALLWYLFYDVGNIEDDKFIYGQELLSNIYGSFKSSLGIGKKDALSYLNNILKVVNVKRAFAFLDKKDINSARKFFLNYLKKNGVFNVFFVFYSASLFGNIFIGKIPLVYTMLLKFKVLIKRGFNNFYPAKI